MKIDFNLFRNQDQQVKKLKGTSRKVAPSKSRKSKKDLAGDSDEKGVIYVGHLPYGFVEEGLQGYFAQFGDVLRVKIMRSKKTARSKGYGFVEFSDRNVAKIAVQAMDGYMMYGTRLVCRLLDKTEEHGNLFIRSNKKFKFIPWHIIYRQNMNKVNFQ